MNTEQLSPASQNDSWMKLYDETCFECSKTITQKYSTSFSLGIKAFDNRFRYPIYAIYGFVRYADEIVDSFHQHDKAELISGFRAETYKAIAEKISMNPVLHSFQDTVNKYKIEQELIDAFLHSMEMDLVKEEYAESTYKEYIYGSAEVVGLMCLRVFCEGNEVLYNELKATARSLGAAFQKINFLRDIKSDFKERGRTYFPGVDFERFDDTAKKEIEADIEQDFKNGLRGIKLLPDGAKAGVFIAYKYYFELFKKIRSTPAAKITETRIRVSDPLKLFLFAKAIMQEKITGI